MIKAWVVKDYKEIHMANCLIALAHSKPEFECHCTEVYVMTKEDLQKMWDAARSQRLERIGSGTGLIPGPFDKNYGGIVLEFKDLEEYMETLSVDKERSEL